MKEPEQAGDDTATTSIDATVGDIGDVETAGETTAAAAIHGPADTTPVGAETMAKLNTNGTHESREADKG